MAWLFRYGVFLVASALLYQWMRWGAPEAVVARRWMVMEASGMTNYKGIAVGCVVCGESVLVRALYELQADII